MLPQRVAEAKETRDELAEIASVSNGSMSKIKYIAEHTDEETKNKFRKCEKGTSIPIHKEYNRLKAEVVAAKAKERSYYRKGKSAYATSCGTARIQRKPNRFG